MRHIGRVLVCKDFLAGNRHSVPFSSGAGREAECIAAAGDYVFTGGWKERGRSIMNRIFDGGSVGVLDPCPSVGGVKKTGWIDILTGITAHKRRDGEYLVFVEEGYKAKALLYRWRPGDLTDAEDPRRDKLASLKALSKVGGRASCLASEPRRARRPPPIRVKNRSANSDARPKWHEGRMKVSEKTADNSFTDPEGSDTSGWSRAARGLEVSLQDQSMLRPAGHGAC
jgi:hypothetical protein